MKKLLLALGFSLLLFTNAFAGFTADNVTITGQKSKTSLATDSNGKIIEGTGGAGANDTAYGVDWNGTTDQAPSQNAVYDKIETLAGGHDAATVANTPDINMNIVGQLINATINTTLKSTWDNKGTSNYTANDIYDLVIPLQNLTNYYNKTIGDARYILFGGTGTSLTAPNGANITGLIPEASIPDTELTSINLANGTGTVPEASIPDTGLTQTNASNSTLGIQAKLYGGTGAANLNDLIALTTNTSGNYVASVATTFPLGGGAAGSEGATLTLTISAGGLSGLNATNATVGVLPVANGGTGSTSGSGAALNNLPSANLTNVLGDLATTFPITGAANDIFTGATGTKATIGITASGLGTLNATNITTGLLPVARGGTNLASGTDGGILGYTATGTIASSALLASTGIVTGGGAGATPVTGVASIKFGSAAGADQVLTFDSNAATDMILKWDNTNTQADLNKALNISTTGNSTFTSSVGIGATPLTPLYVLSAVNVVAQTIKINAAQAAVNASSTYIDFRSTTGSEGSIAGTAVAGVLAYSTFLGSHYTEIVGEIPEVGMVLEMTGEVVGGATPHLAKSRICKTAGSNKVYGVYGGQNKEGKHLVFGLGAGVVLVNGEIEAGDLLEADGKGYAHKQWFPFITSFTLGKAVQSNKGGIKLIGCILYSG